ncbi:MAG: penicillin-binding protein 2 [Planctomycetes bacterium]|nr:penicillin-binding protein 2 [Planctomycetota bacterium]
MNTQTSGEPRKSFGVVSTALAWGLALVFLVVLGRIVQLQLWPSAELVAQITPRVSSSKELPLRGDITDRRGRLLSATRFAERVILDPTMVKDPNKTIVSISKALGCDSDALGRKIVLAMEENVRRAAILAESKDQPIAEEPDEDEMSPEELAELAKGTSPLYGPPAPKRPIRYLKLSDPLSPEQASAVRAAVKADKLVGVTLEKRAVREYAGGEEAASIVGKVGGEEKYITGSEARLNKELSGKPGKIGYVRDASGRPLWVEVGQMQRAVPGKDVRLSMDLEIQRMTHEELEKGVEECDAQGGRAVVMDPNTGEILAMTEVYRPVTGLVPLPTMTKEEAAKRGAIAAKKNEVYNSRARYQLFKPDLDEKGQPKPPGLGRNRCVEDVYEPGSTFKPFVWSTITDLGRARPDEIFDTEGGRWITPTGKPISDVHKAATMTWREVLINSSNIGMIKGAQRLTQREFHDALVRFGFGKPTAIGLSGEASGIVTPLSRWSVFTHTSNAYGNEVAVTPLQMVRAFSAFCRQGELAGTLPRLRLTASGLDGFEDGVVYRVLPERMAVLTRETMRAVTSSMESKYAKTAPDGTPWRYTMFGKSGTARPPVPPIGYLQHQFVPSFIAGGPVEAPRLVVIVVIDDPGPERIAKNTYYGAATAGPIVRRIMERSLTYLGVKPSGGEDIAMAGPDGDPADR